MPLSKEERYARSRAYKATPEARAKRIAYDKKRWAMPEVREAARLRRQTPEYKEKVRIYQKKYRSTPEYKEKKRLYRLKQEYKDKRRDYDFKKNFGITIQEYNLMLESQNKVCAICHRPESKGVRGVIRSLAVDHCHKSGKVRGLLCTACNQTLGHMEDSVELLQNAIEYLRKQ